MLRFQHGIRRAFLRPVWAPFRRCLPLLALLHSCPEDGGGDDLLTNEAQHEYGCLLPSPSGDEEGDLLPSPSGEEESCLLPSPSGEEEGDLLPSPSANGDEEEGDLLPCSGENPEDDGDLLPASGEDEGVLLPTKSGEIPSSSFPIADEGLLLPITVSLFSTLYAGRHNTNICFLDVYEAYTRIPMLEGNDDEDADTGDANVQVFDPGGNYNLTPPQSHPHHQQHHSEATQDDKLQTPSMPFTPLRGRKGYQARELQVKPRSRLKMKRKMVEMELLYINKDLLDPG